MKNLQLKELKVQSFVTEMEVGKAKGGVKHWNTEWDCQISYLFGCSNYCN